MSSYIEQEPQLIGEWQFDDAAAIVTCCAVGASFLLVSETRIAWISWVEAPSIEKSLLQIELHEIARIVDVKPSPCQRFVACRVRTADGKGSHILVGHRAAGIVGIRWLVLQESNTTLACLPERCVWNPERQCRSVSYAHPEPAMEGALVGLTFHWRSGLVRTDGLPADDTPAALLVCDWRSNTGSGAASEEGGGSSLGYTGVRVWRESDPWDQLNFNSVGHKDIEHQLDVLIAQAEVGGEWGGSEVLGASWVRHLDIQAGEGEEGAPHRGGQDGRSCGWRLDGHCRWLHGRLVPHSYVYAPQTQAGTGAITDAPSTPPLRGLSMDPANPAVPDQFVHWMYGDSSHAAGAVHRDWFVVLHRYHPPPPAASEDGQYEAYILSIWSAERVGDVPVQCPSIACVGLCPLATHSLKPLIDRTAPHPALAVSASSHVSVVPQHDGASHEAQSLDPLSAAPRQRHSDRIRQPQATGAAVPTTTPPRGGAKPRSASISQRRDGGHRMQTSMASSVVSSQGSVDFGRQEGEDGDLPPRTPPTGLEAFRQHSQRGARPAHASTAVNVAARIAPLHGASGRALHVLDKLTQALAQTHTDPIDAAAATAPSGQASLADRLFEHYEAEAVRKLVRYRSEHSDMTSMPGATTSGQEGSAPAVSLHSQGHSNPISTLPPPTGLSLLVQPASTATAADSVRIDLVLRLVSGSTDADDDIGVSLRSQLRWLHLELQYIMTGVPSPPVRRESAAQRTTSAHHRSLSLASTIPFMHGNVQHLSIARTSNSVRTALATGSWCMVPPGLALKIGPDQQTILTGRRGPDGTVHPQHFLRAGRPGARVMAVCGHAVSLSTHLETGYAMAALQGGEGSEGGEGGLLAMFVVRNDDAGTLSANHHPVCVAQHRVSPSSTHVSMGSDGRQGVVMLVRDGRTLRLVQPVVLQGSSGQLQGMAERLVFEVDGGRVLRAVAHGSLTAVEVLVALVYQVDGDVTGGQAVLVSVAAPTLQKQTASAVPAGNVRLSVSESGALSAEVVGTGSDQQLRVAVYPIPASPTESIDELAVSENGVVLCLREAISPQARAAWYKRPPTSDDYDTLQRPMRLCGATPVQACTKGGISLVVRSWGSSELVVELDNNEITVTPSVAVGTGLGAATAGPAPLYSPHVLHWAMRLGASTAVRDELLRLRTSLYIDGVIRLLTQRVQEVQRERMDAKRRAALRAKYNSKDSAGVDGPTQDGVEAANGVVPAVFVIDPNSSDSDGGDMPTGKRTRRRRQQVRDPAAERTPKLSITNLPLRLIAHPSAPCGVLSSCCVSPPAVVRASGPGHFAAMTAEAVRQCRLRHLPMVLQSALLYVAHQSLTEGHALATKLAKALGSEGEEVTADDAIQEARHIGIEAVQACTHAALRVDRVPEEAETELTEADLELITDALPRAALPGIDGRESLLIGSLAGVYQAMNHAAAGGASTALLDGAGLNYLLGVKWFFASGRILTPAQRPSAVSAADMMWAVHCETQETLVSQAVPATATWPVLRALGLPLWLRNDTLLRTTVEGAARTQVRCEPFSLCYHRDGSGLTLRACL